MEHLNMLMGVILPYANFFIFLGLAIFFFKKPARDGALKKRTEFLRVMTEAKKSFDEANNSLIELKLRQKNLNDEISEVKKISEVAAENEAARIATETERLVSHLKVEAKRIAAAEVQKAKASIRRDIVVAVCGNVKEKILREVSSEKHLEIVRKNLSELKSIRAEG